MDDATPRPTHQDVVANSLDISMHIKGVASARDKPHAY